MRTFLACAGLDGRDEALDRLVELVEVHSPHAVLFAGGLFERVKKTESPQDTMLRRHREMQLLERFFSTLGSLGVFTGVIPGPFDAPLPVFLRVGMNAELRSPNLHILHAILARDQRAVFCGIGGELTRTEDTYAPVIRCSQTMANYFVRSLADADQPQKVLLLAVPPTGELGNTMGNPVASELIDTYYPRLCVVGGMGEGRGYSRIANTLIVNPGRLSEGNAAFIDWSRGADPEVEILDLGVAATVYL